MVLFFGLINVVTGLNHSIWKQKKNCKIFFWLEHIFARNCRAHARICASMCEFARKRARARAHFLTLRARSLTMRAQCSKMRAHCSKMGGMSAKVHYFAPTMIVLCNFGNNRDKLMFFAWKMIYFLHWFSLAHLFQIMIYTQGVTSKYMKKIMLSLAS